MQDLVPVAFQARPAMRAGRCRLVALDCEDVDLFISSGNAPFAGVEAVPARLEILLTSQKIRQPFRVHDERRCVDP